MPPAGSTKKRASSSGPARARSASPAAAPAAATSKGSSSKASSSAPLLNKNGVPALVIPESSSGGAPAYSPSHAYLEGKKDGRRAYLPPIWVTVVLGFTLLQVLYNIWTAHGAGVVDTITKGELVNVGALSLYLFYATALESASACGLGLVVCLYLVLPVLPTLTLEGVAAELVAAHAAGPEALAPLALARALLLGKALAVLSLLNRLSFANGQTNKEQ